MKNWTLFIALFFSISTLFAQTRTITGRVIDPETKEALIGASVVVKGSTTGSATDVNGNFSLSIPNDAKTLVVSYVGYEPKEVQVSNTNNYSINLSATSVLTTDVTVTSTRTPETVKQASVQIEKMGVREIKSAASGDFYQGLGNFKGIDVVSSSFAFKTINLRGFGGTAAVRSLQLIDGIDNAAPGLNFPVGNLVGINDLDLQSVEVISGAASGLYGASALQGVINMKSKNPYDVQGFSAMLKGGATTRVAPYFEGQFRYAQAFGKQKKWAFKVTGSYMQTKDWIADDDSLNLYGDISTEQNVSEILRKRALADVSETFTQEDKDKLIRLNNWLDFNPIANPNVLDINAPGYRERDLTDYNTYSLKVGGELHYKITNDISVHYMGKFGMGSTVYQGVNRYQIKDITFQQHKLEISGKNFFVRGYGVIENAGNSYDLVFTGINISKASVTDYITAFNTSYFDSLRVYTNDFDADTEAKNWMVDSARKVAIAHADQTGWIQAGSSKFDSLKNEISRDGRLSGLGSKFIDKSSIWHVEGQYNFDILKKAPVKWDAIVGGSYRIYLPNSAGTIFSDTLVNRFDTVPGGDISPNARFVRIRNEEFAFYAQTQFKFFNDHLRLIGTVRMDKNTNFKVRFSPRVAAVVNYGDHNFRVGFATAFRNPTLQNQFINLNLGPITLVGNLEGNNNVYTLQSLQDFNNYYDTAFIPSAENAVKFLQKTSVEKMRPERVTSLDFGYKGDFVKKKLSIDVSGYYSWYRDFLGFTRVVSPNIGVAGEQSGEDQILGKNFTVLQMTANSPRTVPSWGALVDVRYYIGYGIRPYVNYTYTDLDDSNLSTSGNLVLTGFNTPKHKINVGIEGFRVWKGLGFTANFKWVNEHKWENAFADGVVPAYHVLDLQVAYEFEKLHSALRVGGSNIYNNLHIEAVGAPRLGALYYVSWTFDYSKFIKQ
jgi:outer membrane receptor protein involved in Fe transport